MQMRRPADDTAPNVGGNESHIRPEDHAWTCIIVGREAATAENVSGQLAFLFLYHNNILQI
jgi:hypothetical protein